MCGISGFLHFDQSRPASLPVLRQMSEVLVHRGPDGQGFHIKDNLALAHQRLAIIDLATGHQPMYNNDRSIAIVFNGEIYNYLELRNELKTLSYSFSTSSDTEVLIHAYEQWGTNLHEKLNGMWAFALWDDRKKQLLLSRDRLGEKPLHYAVYDNTLFFGSEIKSITACGIPPQANLDVLELYLALGYIPAPFTFFKNIHKLLPGHYLLVKDGRYQSHKYWDLPTIDENKMLTNKKDIYEQFEFLLRDSVRLRMRSEGQKYLQQEFSFEKMTTAYIDLYRKLINPYAETKCLTN
jgi:asparagine synthase (glutamine-hydrolysing)